jgi:hypothetical protein
MKNPATILIRSLSEAPLGLYDPYGDVISKYGFYNAAGAVLVAQHGWDLTIPVKSVLYPSMGYGLISEADATLSSFCGRNYKNFLLSVQYIGVGNVRMALRVLGYFCYTPVFRRRDYAEIEIFLRKVMHGQH